MVILGEEDLTRRRFAAGSWSSGDFTRGAGTDSTIRGSWQPVDGQILATLPEAERSLDQRWVCTTSDLRVAEQGTGTVADYVSQDGATWYEVRQVARARSILPHFEARVVRVKEPG